MACPAAGIGEGLTADGHELPAERPISQRQLEHAERAGVAYFTVGKWGGKRIKTAAAGPHHERPDAGGVIELTARRLRTAALILVVVARDGDFGAVVVQRLPQRLHTAITAVIGARAEARIMHVGDRALL